MLVGSVLIFDWDDTICPSSTIDALGKDTIADFPPQLQATFLNICHKTKEMIALAKSCGDVVIITNSDEGWVKFSAGKFMPSLLPLLDEVEIVSARTRYERLYPRQPLCWKAAAFAHEVNERFHQMDEQDDIFGFGEEDSRETAAAMLQQHIEAKNAGTASHVPSTTSPSASSLPPSPPSAQPMDIPTTSPDKSKSFSNDEDLPHQVTPPSSSQPSPVGTMKVKERRQIISFGDSLEERTAVKIVSSQLGALCKSVKFLSQPSPLMILGQLELLSDYMRHICQQPEELDLEISQEQAMNAAERFLNKAAVSSVGVTKISSPPITNRKAVRGVTNNNSVVSIERA